MHSFHIGLDEQNASVILPMSLDELLQKVPNLVREPLVDFVCSAYSSFKDDKHLEHEQAVKRWVSRAV